MRHRASRCSTSCEPGSSSPTTSVYCFVPTELANQDHRQRWQAEMNLIETVPAGAMLAVHQNGRLPGIVESDAEEALTRWGQRQRKNKNRTNTVVSDRGVIYGFHCRQWRTLS
jgi:hypothetical protein